MNGRVAFFAVLLLPAVRPAAAHRLDEYLQATHLAVAPDGIRIEMYLTPGVAALPAVLVGIDTNHDGTISRAEQQLYAEQVRGDIVLTLNGERMALKIEKISFPEHEAMQEGLGEINLVFRAALGPGQAKGRLRLENRHQSGMSVYQVNCLVPETRAVRVGAQFRNIEQSEYELEYVVERD